MRGRLTGLGVAALALNCLATVNAANAQTPPAAQAAKIEQGWSDQQKANWYTISQGSRLLPLDWLLALEQPGDNQKKFLDPEYIKSFRYLPDASPANSSFRSALLSTTKTMAIFRTPSCAGNRAKTKARNGSG